ncbi:DedA family protein [Pararhodobacter aggregans]|uniref:DedA family protein n=1 Tax=Pararhodobacter aggregans TaxID=404875 RepID=A0A2T7UU87_9RHOB|nr:VTT domain-containing protein [Pararhodobacter aggregans]PTX04217.1 membrane protein DedA with SNARE-associated domain [Pararhodobacter aggregans]PVE48335.1 DedA family protein [Pararhodobacter aggregans]
MTDWMLAQVADWGPLALAIVTFLSCLAIPVPSSMMMLTAGAFAASGDLALAPAAAAALAGAVLGDQAGYQLGRLGFRQAEGWLLRSRTRAAVLERARHSVQKGGGVAVFLSRWLFSVLGPYVNLLAGGAGMTWLTFTVMGVLGEMIWVVAYIGLGYLAGGQIAQASEILGNALGLLASLALTLGLGWMLWRRTHRHSAP